MSERPCTPQDDWPEFSGDDDDPHRLLADGTYLGWSPPDDDDRDDSYYEARRREEEDGLDPDD